MLQNGRHLLLQHTYVECLQACTRTSSADTQFLHSSAALDKVEAEDGEVKAQYLDYLRQYRLCLAEKHIPKLEDAWRALDEKWMKIRRAYVPPGEA